MRSLRVGFYGALSKYIKNGEVELEVCEKDMVKDVVLYIFDEIGISLDMPLIYLLDGQKVEETQAVGNSRELTVIQAMFGG